MYILLSKEPGHDVNSKRSAAGRSTLVCNTLYQIERAEPGHFLFALVVGV